jgi:hypothetical protein
MHHLNRHMIEVHDGRFNSNGTYIELGALVYEHKHCKGIFAWSMLTLDAIRSMHADYYDLPDDTRIDNISAKSSKSEDQVTGRGHN